MPIVVEILVSSIFSYTPTLPMKIDPSGRGLKLTFENPNLRSKRLGPRSSGLSHAINVAFNPLLLAPI